MNQLLDLNGKISLVTGAARGNGKAIANFLVNLGAKVVAADIVYEDDKTFAGNLSQLFMDVTNEESVASGIDRIQKAYGRLDILVNNAGVIYKDFVQDMDLGQWRNLIEVNTTGAVICTKYAARVMKPMKWGRIVNISSVQAFLSFERYGAYGASKAALSHLTRIWALELAPDNITVNALCPSYVETPMMENTIRKRQKDLNVGREEALEGLLAPIPLKRLLRPEEIGYWVAVLCSDMGGGVTGSNISVSAGWLRY